MQCSPASVGLVFMFVDDTKCLQPISSPRDCILLQSDLDALSLRSTTWKLTFKRPNVLSCQLDLLMKTTTVISSTTNPLYQVVFKKTSESLSHPTFPGINIYPKLHLKYTTSQDYFAGPLVQPTIPPPRNNYIEMESLQRRATKYILNDYNSDYRTRLIKLHLLPIAMLLELNDICFFITSLKTQTLLIS